MAKIKKKAVASKVTKDPHAPKQAARANKGKPELGRILDFPYAMEAFAKVCTAGDTKYTRITGKPARYNWRLGFPVSELVNSAMRHIMKVHNAVDMDEETKCFHMAEAMWNCATFIETLERHGKKFDDRDVAGGLKK